MNKTFYMKTENRKSYSPKTTELEPNTKHKAGTAHHELDDPGAAQTAVSTWSPKVWTFFTKLEEPFSQGSAKVLEVDRRHQLEKWTYLDGSAVALCHESKLRSVYKTVF